MSQFDYPRLNFAGKATVNAATANNVNYRPLVYYDPIQVKVLLPPRVYLTGVTYTHGYTRNDVIKLLPAGALRRKKNAYYFTIDPITTREQFLEWMTTPLGECPLDKPYHPIYEMIQVQGLPPADIRPLKGLVPAYWNYYGDMKFEFNEVEIVSVALSSKEGEQIIDSNSHKKPAGIADLLGAQLTLNNGAMIDVTPSTSTLTQVFAESMVLSSASTNYFTGKPLKATIRAFNISRITGEEPPFSLSGQFYSAIPTEYLADGDASPLIRIFQKLGPRNRKLRGIFVRYNMFEVIEKNPFTYQPGVIEPNPARTTIAGSLSPWYEDEMASMSVGRKLVLAEPFDGNNFLGPIIAHVDPSRRCLAVDLLNNIPEVKNDDGSYEVYKLGTLDLRLQADGGKEHSLGKLAIGPSALNRAGVLQNSGMWVFPCDLGADVLQGGQLMLYRLDQQGKATLLMKEMDYLVVSDEAGLYANAGDDPAQGYLSYSGKKQPCVLRIFYRGVPVTEPRPFTIVEFLVTEIDAGINASILRHHSYRDGDVVTFPTSRAANAIYLFLPGLVNKPPQMNMMAVFVMGSDIHLRVLPHQDYDRYLDPHHPEYVANITFDILYEEIFKTYDLIYPIMGKIIPFTAASYQNKDMAVFLKFLTSLDNWDSYRYMPSTRDLTSSQRRLIERWVAQFDKLEEPAGDEAMEQLFKKNWKARWQR